MSRTNPNVQPKWFSRGRRLRTPEQLENLHHARTVALRWRIVRDGRTLAGYSQLDTARRALAVFSRDGELDGFSIVGGGR